MSIDKKVHLLIFFDKFFLKCGKWIEWRPLLHKFFMHARRFCARREGTPRVPSPRIDLKIFRFTQAAQLFSFDIGELLFPGEFGIRLDVQAVDEGRVCLHCADLELGRVGDGEADDVLPFFERNARRNVIILEGTLDVFGVDSAVQQDGGIAQRLAIDGDGEVIRSHGEVIKFDGQAQREPCIVDVPV